ncbi:hypothetical protein OHS33_12845 [Streptomyces sp. NBC_00536]|uniref:hypothetical protein n=1 Tax=Streptomyces sp. NBC_00536 TaxID=2975769 RepID=UPI002E80E233|nr:hypothetical protein [Streptomyces sp. NBC_00536]WUC79148.1 hypothetical protein OHS33_12845 [Streptomyces sp. NBC_00536]
MKRPFVIALATVGVIATAAVALPNLPPNPLTDTVNARLFNNEEKTFATAADAPKQGDPAFVLPDWIPQDAKKVKVKAHTTGDAKLIRFTLGRTPLAGPQCAGAPAQPGTPKLGAKWWPKGTEHGVRPECRGGYQVVVRGEKVYAWTNGAVAPTAVPAGTTMADATPTR